MTDYFKLTNIKKLYPTIDTEYITFEDELCGAYPSNFNDYLKQEDHIEVEIEEIFEIGGIQYGIINHPIPEYGLEYVICGKLIAGYKIAYAVVDVDFLTHTILKRRFEIKIKQAKELINYLKDREDQKPDILELN